MSVIPEVQKFTKEINNARFGVHKFTKGLDLC